MDESKERETIAAAIIAGLPKLSLDELKFIYSYIVADQKRD